MSTEDRVLQVIRDFGPMTVRQLAKVLSIHSQTARRKAEGLVGSGKASRHAMTVDGHFCRTYEAIA